MRFKNIGPSIFTPFKRAEDAGYDLISTCLKIIKPHETVKVRTGIAVEIPSGHVGLLMGRSSLNAKGLVVAIGVIDSGYRGEIVATITNTTEIQQIIYEGDRCCQLVIVPCYHGVFQCCGELSDSERGEKGFGSSGT